jgi:hypothetical protein
MSHITVPAHYDGERIHLDKPVRLPINARLLVTVLEEEDDHDLWLRFSAANLARAYGEDEPEYGLEDIKEPNPYYDGR